jgi:hypothetical protein
MGRNVASKALLLTLVFACGGPHSAPPPADTEVPSPAQTQSTFNPASVTFPVVDVMSGGGGLRMHSLDKGKSWQYTSDGTLASDCWEYRSMTYANGLWLGISSAAGYSRVSTSPNGVHWRNYESQIPTRSVAYGNGKWVSEKWTSTDGYNFTPRDADFSEADIGGRTKLTFINGTFIVTGDGQGIATSTDGDHFTTVLPGYPAKTPFGSNITDWAVGNGIVVGLGFSRIVSSSDNGQTWTNQDDYFGYGMTADLGANGYNGFFTILFDGSQFVINGRFAPFGQTAMTWTSTDGVNWTRTPATSAVFFAGGVPGDHLAGFTDGNFGTPAALFGSVDMGLTWRAATSIEPSSFYDFSTPQNPVANPVITNWTGWFPSHIVAGVPSADPTSTPNLPPNVYLPADQLTNFCTSDLPPGR